MRHKIVQILKNVVLGATIGAMIRLAFATNIIAKANIEVSVRHAKNTLRSGK